jgi:hypothetical protein
MAITKILTKKLLENLIKEVFLNLGSIKTSQLLDSIKAFGFFYATCSGLSISLEDLKSPEKKEIISEYSKSSIATINKNWIRGFVTDTERFQNILNHWTTTTEILKNEVIKHYKIYDPANSLYIMAFSGARGNISQVRQIVGIRGLMTDQAGNVITFPIESNFREGLTSIDYLISAYGARKGIVDTALKTANAGYLTRRLIFLGQEIIIRQIDCKTNKGIIINLSKNSNNNLLGRYCKLALQKDNYNYSLIPKLTNTYLNIINYTFFENKNVYMVIQSPLTCRTESSLCQKCYGWDLSKYNKISLGQAVGIIAAQSIGEPGTQLTMRTFHTGGVFTGNMVVKYFPSPFSGKILYYKNLDGLYKKNLFGENVLKLSKALEINIFNWKTGTNKFKIPQGLEFLISKTSFIKKGEKIADLESSQLLQNYGIKNLVPVYSPISGYIIGKKLSFKKISKGIHFALKNSRITIALGNPFVLPLKTKYRNLSNLAYKKSLGYLNILISPVAGLIIIDKEIITIYSKFKKFQFDLETSFKSNKIFELKKSSSNLKTEIIFLVKKYQFIDKETIFGRIEKFPILLEDIYKVYHKKNYNLSTKILFCLKKSDTYSIFADQIANIFYKLKLGEIYDIDKKFTSTLSLPIKGKLISQDGLNFIFQRIHSINIPKGSIFYKKINKKYFYKGELMFHSIIYKQQSNDIVQGLPKIDHLIEAKKTVKNNILLRSPGIFLGTKNFKINYLYKNFYNKNTSYYSFFFDKQDNNDKIFGQRSNLIFQTKKNYSNLNSNLNYNLNNIFSIEKKKNDIIKFKFNSKINKINPNYTIKKSAPFSILNINKEIKNKFFNFLQVGQNILDITLNPHVFLRAMFGYFLNKKRIRLKACIFSRQKLQLLLLNSIQSIYYHQGVKISNKHIELIVRQLTSKIVINNLNHSKILKKRIIYFSIFETYIKSIKNLIQLFEKNLFFKYNTDIKLNDKIKYKSIFVKQLKMEEKNENLKIFPIYIGCTNNSTLKNAGFLTSAGFQDTKRVLAKAALFGSIDWLRGLKDSIIAGKLLPSGSTYLYNKNYLDTLYYYKRKR